MASDYRARRCASILLLQRLARERWAGLLAGSAATRELREALVQVGRPELSEAWASRLEEALARRSADPEGFARTCEAIASEVAPLDRFGATGTRFIQSRFGTRDLVRTHRRLLEVRNDLIADHLGLVRHALRRLAAPPALHDDLFHEGALGLMRALELYDPGRKTRFSTYAMFWIRNEMRRGLDRQRAVVKLPVAMRGRLGAGQDPRARELDLDRLGETPDWNRRLDDQRQLVIMRRAFAQLEPRERVVLSRRYELDAKPTLTLRELGSELGLSRERVRQIQRRALEKLRVEIERTRSPLPGGRTQRRMGLLHDGPDRRMLDSPLDADGVVPLA